MSIDSKDNMPSSRMTNATTHTDSSSNLRGAAAVRSSTIVKSCMKKASASAHRQQQPNQKYSMTTSSRSGTNSSVHFNPRTSVRVIPTLDKYTDEELTSCFWSEQDDIASKDHIVETVKAIRAGELGEEDSDNDQHCCARGLEQLATVGARDEVKQRRRRILHAVMDEQDFQWSQNIEDDVRIAIVALRESVPSRNTALVAAAQDAAYIRRMDLSFASQYISKSSLDREVVKRSGRNHSSPLSRNAKSA